MTLSYWNYVYVEKSSTQSLALMVKDTLYFLLTKKVFTSVNNAIRLKLKNVFICQALKLPPRYDTDPPYDSLQSDTICEPLLPTTA